MERLADNVKVSTIVVNMIFERNTPKLNLTLYVPILILLALFLGSILIPSKLLHLTIKGIDYLPSSQIRLVGKGSRKEREVGKFRWSWNISMQLEGSG